MTTAANAPQPSAIDLAALRNILVKLFDDPTTIRRLASDAGIAIERTASDGGAVNAWFTVLDEANKSGKVKALLTVAVKEYPEDEGLLAAHEALVRASAPPVAPAPAAITAAPLPPPVVPTVAAPFDPKRAHFFVPFQPKGEAVIGRESALAQVRKQLVEGRRTAIGQAASFSGLGGLGKTQLAVEYAHTWGHDYKGGVYWFTADSDLDGQLARLAREARWVSPDADARYQLEVAEQQVRTRSHCLIIFDNVEHLDQIERLLPMASATPHLLLTSRLPQRGFPQMALDHLDPEQSLLMLTSESGRTLDDSDDRAAAQKIAAQLDGLPLALELVGAYLRRYPAARWSAYAEQLEAQGIEARSLRESLKYESFTKHEDGLHATLRISERVLDEAPMLRDVLDLLAWSGAASMSVSLLAAMLAIEAVRLNEALDVAVSVHLVKREVGPGANREARYQMHRLVRDVRRLDVPFAAQHARWSEVPRRLGDWFEARRKEFNELARFEAEIDHLDAWQKQAELLGQSREAVRLLWLRAYPHYHRGQYRQSQTAVVRALEMFRAGGVEDRALLAHLLHDLGATTALAGDHRKGLEYQQEALTIRLEVLGERNAETASSFNSVGFSLNALGDHGKAMEHAERALAIRHEVLGVRHPDFAESLNEVGVLFGHLGDQPKAREYAQHALAIYLEALGEHHPHTTRSLNNVGASYSALGDYRAASEYMQQALTINREVLGETHPQTLFSRRNVATCLINLKKRPAALQIVDAGLKHAPHDRELLELRAALVGRPAPAKPAAKKKR